MIFSVREPITGILVYEINGVSVPKIIWDERYNEFIKNRQSISKPSAVSITDLRGLTRYTWNGKLDKNGSCLLWFDIEDLCRKAEL